MNMDDLYNVIMATQKGLAWAESFRHKRVRLLTSEDSPIQFAGQCKILVHIVPLGDRPLINLRLDNSAEVFRRRGTNIDPAIWTYNSDGALRFRGEREAVMAYWQVLRNGILEQGVTYGQTANQNQIPGALMDNFLTFNIPDGVEALKELGQQLPMAVSVTLIGVKNWTIAGLRNPVPIDRDIVWLDWIVIDSLNKDSNEVIASLIDAVWNTSGFERSPNIP